jgi:cupin fold WbuC family metalloprotein
MIIDKSLLDQVSAQAKVSPRLRMNYNFHQSLEDKCHRFLNAVEPGTVVPIHRHPTKDESFVILRGKVRVTTHNDDGSIIEDVVLSQESGNYGVDIPLCSSVHTSLFRNGEESQ